MRIQVVTHPEYRQLHDELTLLPQHFEEEGTIVYQGRNLIKALRIGGTLRNVKSFKIPHWLNRFVYAYFRPSKAKRSFTYANLLLAKGIGTPCPIAYLVERSFWGIRRSYYVSEQVAFDYEFRDLRVQNPSDLEAILRAFTRFTWQFHQAGIYFIDHSPGNTLIQREEEGYRFYLVDLNRMKFKHITPYKGLKNFYRLNATDEMIAVIADEYARLTHSDATRMTSLLKKWTHRHDRQVQKQIEKRNAKKAFP